METYILEVLKQENEFLRIMITESLQNSLAACKSAEAKTKETLDQFNNFYNRKSEIDYPLLPYSILKDEFKDIPLPQSPKNEVESDEKIMEAFLQTFKPSSSFNHSLFIEKCDKQIIQFLMYLEKINIPSNNFDVTKECQLLPFSTLFTLLDILSDCKVLNYKLGHQTMDIYENLWDSKKILKFNTDKKYLSYSESLKLKLKLEEIGVILK
jgi:hypothetical protein